MAPVPSTSRYLSPFDISRFWSPAGPLTKALLCAMHDRFSICLRRVLTRNQFLVHEQTIMFPNDISPPSRPAARMSALSCIGLTSDFFNITPKAQHCTVSSKFASSPYNYPLSFSDYFTIVKCLYISNRGLYLEPFHKKATTCLRKDYVARSPEGGFLNILFLLHCIPSIADPFVHPAATTSALTLMSQLSFSSYLQWFQQQTAATHWSMQHRSCVQETDYASEASCTFLPLRTAQHTGPPPAVFVAELDHMVLHSACVLLRQPHQMVLSTSVWPSYRNFLVF